MAKMTLLSPDDDLYEVGDFIELCQDGTFIDYDGHGYYATPSHASDEIVHPSDILAGKINRKYDHVVWYNR